MTQSQPRLKMIETPPNQALREAFALGMLPPAPWFQVEAPGRNGDWRVTRLEAFESEESAVAWASVALRGPFQVVCYRRDVVARFDVENG